MSILILRLHYHQFSNFLPNSGDNKHSYRCWTKIAELVVSNDKCFAGSRDWFLFGRIYLFFWKGGSIMFFCFVLFVPFDFRLLFFLWFPSLRLTFFIHCNTDNLSNHYLSRVVFCFEIKQYIIFTSVNKMKTITSTNPSIEV